MQSRTSRGFTLVELLVVLVIAGLLLLAGVPRLASVFDSFTASSSSERLVSSLAYARGQAVFLQSPVSVCSGVGSCADSTVWSGGWTVFSDKNGDGQITGADKVLRVVEAVSAKADVAFADKTITFDRHGENTASNNSDFVICATSGSHNSNKTVRVTLAGYVSTNAGATCS